MCAALVVGYLGSDTAFVGVEYCRTTQKTSQGEGNFGAEGIQTCDDGQYYKCKVHCSERHGLTAKDSSQRSEGIDLRLVPWQSGTIYRLCYRVLLFLHQISSPLSCPVLVKIPPLVMIHSLGLPEFFGPQELSGQ